MRTIQPMGKKPVATPSSVARIACPAGMVKTAMATNIAVARAANAVRCALTLPDARRTRSVTTGIAAVSVDSC